MPASWKARTIALNSATTALGLVDDEYSACGAKNPKVL